MKYIVQQIFKTTVCDQEISECDSILELLESLKKASIDIFFEIRDIRSGVSISYKKCRIKKVEKDTVDVLSFYGRGGRTMLRAVKFENIIMIKMVTDSYNTIIQDKKIQRSDLLDLDSDVK